MNVTMREPRLIPEAQVPARRAGRVAANPALPNLILLSPVGSWPTGAIIAKDALPHGFQGHLDLGVVVETERPVTHGTALHSAGAPGPIGDAAEVARLRGVVADYEGKLAALQTALAERDVRIVALTNDLAAAEDLVRSLSEAREVVESTGRDSGLVAVAAPGLPQVAPPWTN